MSTLRVPVGPEDHTAGEPTAACTLVEYGDYECPHCSRAYPIVKRVQKHFGKRLRLVYRNFPLTQAHPHAEAAAETAEFAAAQEKFWEMHDGLYENQGRLGVSLFLTLADEMELDSAALRVALQQHQFAARVKADFNGGVRSGVNGTPTFFLNGKRHDGSFDFEDLIGTIEAAAKLT